MSTLSLGKDYALLHAAPIVAVFILDHDAQPLPSPSEVENRAVPGKSHPITTPIFQLLPT